MEVTEDRILGGKLLIRQPKRGYRVNVDTILLAATLAPKDLADGTRIAEPGCGVGGAVLAAALRGRAARFTGLERDPAKASLARENVALNRLDERVTIIECDALTPDGDLGRFDRVIINPPYDYEGEGRPPSEERRGSHVAERPLVDWIKVWSNRMAAGASLTLIHRAHRLKEILVALEGRLGGVEILPIRPYAGAAASRVIVRGWKGSRAPLKLLAGLDLHPGAHSTDKHTPETEAILRGEAFLHLR